MKRGRSQRKDFLKEQKALSLLKRKVAFLRKLKKSCPGATGKVLLYKFTKAFPEKLKKIPLEKTKKALLETPKKLFRIERGLRNQKNHLSETPTQRHRRVRRSCHRDLNLRRRKNQERLKNEQHKATRFRLKLLIGDLGLDKRYNAALELTDVCEQLDLIPERRARRKRKVATRLWRRRRALTKKVSSIQLRRCTRKIPRILARAFSEARRIRAIRALRRSRRTLCSYLYKKR